MEKRLLVFAGAGASKAVSSEGYPTTVDFFGRLPEEVTGQPYFQLLKEYLQGRGRSQAQVDVEVVLWHFHELRDQLSAMARTDHFLGWMLEGDRLSRATGVQIHRAGARQSAMEGLPRLTALVDSINRLVFDLYKRAPEKDELEATWLPLLSGLSASEWQVELVTTNYDVVLEHALVELEKSGHPMVDPGWSTGVYRALDLDRWAQAPFEGGKPGVGQGLLTKLHGSVNWSREGEEIFISDPGYKGRDDRHAIIYPGFKGRPAAEPFLTMHQYFVRALTSANVVVFVGFAFRDEYINELCERYVRPSSRVFVLNPNSLQRLPFPSETIQPQIQQAFDKSAIDVLLERLR